MKIVVNIQKNIILNKLANDFWVSFIRKVYSYKLYWKFFFGENVFITFSLWEIYRPIRKLFYIYNNYLTHTECHICREFHICEQIAIIDLVNYF